MRVSLVRRVAAAGLPLALLFAGLTPARAETVLESAAPAADTSVVAPAELWLSFSANVDAKASTVRITGSDGAQVIITGLACAPKDAKQLIVSLPQPLGPGKYLVEWHGVDTEGHQIEGRYTFTVTA